MLLPDKQHNSTTCAAYLAIFVTIKIFIFKPVKSAQTGRVIPQSKPIADAFSGDEIHCLRRPGAKAFLSVAAP
jgi:hypothetical protein